MAIRVAVRHKTTYSYDRPVSLSPHLFRLRPAVHSRTAIEAYSFKLKPADHFINWQQDPFGNYQARVVFPEKTKSMEIEVEVIANLQVINPFDFFVEEYAEEYPFAYSPLLAKELAPYLEHREDGFLLKKWVDRYVDSSRKTRIVDFLVALNQQLNKDIAYTTRMEPGVQTPDETLTRALGSCRDSAWLLVHVLRHAGLAARFVSGYLVQLKTDEKSLDGPSGPEADFTDLHAWAEVYVPGAGWIGLDPTSGLFAGEGHIPLACTADYASAAPVVGATDKCEVSFSFENTVTRIYEDPRVTKPFSEEQWVAINAIGCQVDKDLEVNDVRLTMGGEPTFVAIDDMESGQWNTAADGYEKRILSHDLIFRLRDKFGPGGLIHYGQGKWYPGEPLPRWQYGLYWRKDGYPVWKNINLIAHEKTSQNLTGKDAEIFIKELARHLAVSPENASPAYEDVFYFLWTEGKNPVNVDPLKANLKDPLERRTLTQLLNQGLGDPVGYVLPLQWNYWNNKWLSCKWVFNREHLYLIPGNSPIGLRLPLDSLPVVAKAKMPQQVERSLFEEMPALDFFHDTITARYGTITVHEEPPQRVIHQVTEAPVTEPAKKGKTPAKKEDPPEPEPDITFEVTTIKTALSAEIRNGILYLFIPPMHYLEHYLDVMASIEATAAKLQMPVRIEGYEPPRDNRLERLVVSPDPGVIEVNIHPAKSWKELCYNTDVLYEQARLSRLGTEKFMLDGRHTGTGGGNHITIGGSSPANSPLLRRPDLLRSLITFWQHHPALSYLFSGAFVGPTSQAPRIDEGLEDNLYEMEIAFSQVPEKGFIPFWITDRIFRHLLTDITGNTHRSEFCIDKLYSPDSSSGRLGILEFRGFDMPPHKHMSLLQSLLIRALIAAFWKKPYKHKLVRWGTALYDKYLLPHFVKEDMVDVVEYLNKEGYSFDINWFNAFFEFRFPHYGSVTIRDIEMELRMGIEPWHVLGEEMSNTGTARFVDSSLERVQVKLKGMVDSRHILLCNGSRVPLTATGVKGEFVCGIRYRAWQPPSALHPTIGVDTPLTFDMVDTWNGRSIGGCTYYVSHPGGRSYDTFPVNSFEAESRRISRFGNTSHTQGQQFVRSYLSIMQHYVENNRQPFLYDAPVPEINSEFPCTLDLRKKKSFMW
ncbi:transglutaminase family protein [Pseudoflavitalea sp. X16]|uniref:transglutaminase family protein n=1 Tax=Paraflavitalea devenefica TaxID=2716334 RepID=UPI00141F7D0D|nr:transglutaminase family protein [Paraflavitalea devenefica]NII29536.1 transglutaminase family protein [Paraflavitalea devenefica]